jgi:Flp pilus assembly pilin Flp
MARFARLILRLLATDETAASIVEYAMLLALIALLAVSAIALLGTTLSGFFASVPASL